MVSKNSFLCSLNEFHTDINFIKKESLAHVFSCEFCEISKNNFFTEHLRTTASVTDLYVKPTDRHQYLHYLSTRL